MLFPILGIERRNTMPKMLFCCILNIMKLKNQTMRKQKFNLPLINAHTHAAMVGFRGLGEDAPLDVWLNKYIFQRKKIYYTIIYLFAD